MGGFPGGFPGGMGGGMGGMGGFAAADIFEHMFRDDPNFGAFFSGATVVQVKRKCAAELRLKYDCLQLWLWSAREALSGDHRAWKSCACIYGHIFHNLITISKLLPCKRKSGCPMVRWKRVHYER